MNTIYTIISFISYAVIVGAAVTAIVAIKILVLKQDKMYQERHKDFLQRKARVDKKLGNK